MNSIKKLLSLVVLTSILTGSLQCMNEGVKQDESCIKEVFWKDNPFALLPQDILCHITDLIMGTTLGYNFSLFKQVQVEGRISSVAYSPDGKTVFMGSLDKNTACLWDVEVGDSSIGKQLQVFKGHTDYVKSLALSSDGKTVLTGSGDRTARLWDVETGKQLREFKPTPYVSSLALSPDGKTVLTGSRDKTVCLWDVEVGNSPAGKKLHMLIGHTSMVMSAVFSSDGKTVLTGSHDKTARLWDVKTGKQLQVFNGHTNAITSVAYSSNGNTILTGSGDYTACLWDVKTGKQLQVFKGHTSTIASVAYGPNGNTILTGSAGYSSVACLWDIETGKLLQVFKGHTIHIDAVAYSTNGITFLTGSDDGTVNIWKCPPYSNQWYSRPESALKLATAMELHKLMTVQGNSYLSILKKKIV